ALAPYPELHGRPGRHGTDLPRELPGILDRLAVDRGDHVTRLDARLRGRTVRLRFGYQGALVLFQSEAVGDVRCDLLNLHADPAAGHFPALLELRNHGLDRIGRDRKPDAH